MIYDYSNPEHKFFFAGFLNAAMDNFDLSLKELDRRINSKQNNSKSIIGYAFNEKERPAFELKRNFDILKESLTFLESLPSYHSMLLKEKKTDESFYTYVKNFLSTLYTNLNDLRNYYTHYIHEEVEIDQRTIDFLNYILFNNANRVKKDRAKNDEVKKRLWHEHKEEFKKIVNEHNVDKTGKEKVKDKDAKNFVINRMFRMFIYEDKGKKIYELKKSINCGNDNKITQSGLIQFLALFLDKKQMNQLFDNIDYTYDNASELQKKIARWVYTYKSYKSIRYLFKSDYNKDALLLQMASELNKCPKELYPYLSDEKKQEFVEDVNIYLKDNAEKYNDLALVAHEVIRKRYEDKFAYFAIRFLDEMINFPNLRFQVNVGRFNHNTMSKKHKSTQLTTERSVLETISVFEKLTVVTEKKKKYFIDNPDLQLGWEEFPKPKYQFNGNSIGIWLPDNTLGKSIAPKKRENDKLSKYALVEKLGLKEQYKSPVAYLSVYELPALLHYLLVEGHSPEDVENKIKEKIKKHKIEFSQIAKNTTEINVENRKIARKIKLLKNNETFYKDKAIKWLEKKELNVKPLEDIRKNYQKPPKYPNQLSLSEKGKIATWLSKDIKRFTKKATRENWKGHQFAEFQTLLSYYDIDKNKVEQFMKIDLGINSNTSFMNKCIKFSQPTLYDFYTTYIECRKKYIVKLISKIKENKNVSETIFTIFPKNKFSTVKDIGTFFKEKTKLPIMLPRGVFYDNPTGYSNQEHINNNLAEWFTTASKREFAQEFYSYTRKYPVNDNNNKTVIISISPNKGIKEQFSDGFSKNKSIKNIYKNEAVLRRHMRNDFYILQMIKYFYRDQTEIKAEELKRITLKDFYLTKAEKLEKSKTEKEDKSFNESFILRKQVNISLYDEKVTGRAKLKEAGKYKRLLQDNKVATLVSYSEKKWDIDDILLEIDDYENIRSKVFFKTVHDIEKQIYDEAKQLNKTEKLLQNGHPNFKKYLMFHLLSTDESLYNEFDAIEVSERTIDTIPEALKNIYVMVMIRNKFAHNQLVSKEIFDYTNKLIPRQDDEKIGTYFNRVFNEFYNNYKKKG